MHFNLTINFVVFQLSLIFEALGEMLNPALDDIVSSSSETDDVTSASSSGADISGNAEVSSGDCDDDAAYFPLVMAVARHQRSASLTSPSYYA